MTFQEANVARRWFLSLLVPLLLCPAAPAATPKNDKPRVCVLDFPVVNGAYDGWPGWGYGGGRESISGALQDLFTTEFINDGSGKIRLIERERLDKVVAEQKLDSSGMVDDKTAVSMGKILGVRYMLTGKVTRFAYKKSGFGTGWGVTALLNKVNPNGGAANDIAGDVHVGKASFTGRLDVRLIDVQTSEILAAASDEGTAKDLSVKVAGTGNNVQYDQELVNKIFEPVVQRITKKIIPKIVLASQSADDDQ
jgi:curli biogenesis system outer membrane secretion channel CsgG